VRVNNAFEQSVTNALRACASLATQCRGRRLDAGVRRPKRNEAMSTTTKQSHPYFLCKLTAQAQGGVRCDRSASV